MKVLVLGAGKMVEAFLLGLKKSHQLSDWSIYSPSGTSASRLAAKVGARAISHISNVESPDWILVGCKPQQLKELKKILPPSLKEALYVSLLAAITEEEQLKILEAGQLIRCMPNLSVEFNEGVILLSSRSAQSRLGSFQSLFSKLGMAMVLEERELDELTLLTGSGPAFFYEFAHALAESFSSLHTDQRQKLVRQVLKGASKSLSDSPLTLAEMTSAVSSQGGVTVAVLEEWRRSQFSDFILRGIEAGKERRNQIRADLQN